MGYSDRDTRQPRTLLQQGTLEEEERSGNGRLRTSVVQTFDDDLHNFALGSDLFYETGGSEARARPAIRTVDLMSDRGDQPSREQLARDGAMSAHRSRMSANFRGDVYDGRNYSRGAQLPQNYRHRSNVAPQMQSQDRDPLVNESAVIREQNDREPSRTMKGER
jgi:hypothetical protein